MKNNKYIPPFAFVVAAVLASSTALPAEELPTNPNPATAVETETETRPAGIRPVQVPRTVVPVRREREADPFMPINPLRSGSTRRRASLKKPTNSTYEQWDMAAHIAQNYGSRRSTSRASTQTNEETAQAWNASRRWRRKSAVNRLLAVERDRQNERAIHRGFWNAVERNR